MTRLTKVTLRTEPRVAQIYCAIGDVPSDGGAHIRFGDAVIELVSGHGESGLSGITLSDVDITERARALKAAGVAFEENGAGLSIAPVDANGIAVELREDAAGAVFPAAAHLDHVALRVRNLVDASARWEVIAGVSAEQMGVHPISAGAFHAARLVLGDRMIELISPVPGVESPIAARLESHGEGPAALALPVDDVDAARTRLEAIGARVLSQPPHWMAHPIDAGGILVQLTPRVAH